MATTERPTLAVALQIAQQLDPADQARLASHLLSGLIPLLAETSARRGQGVDPDKLLELIRDDFRKQGPTSPSITEELIAMREERERSVHP